MEVRTQEYAIVVGSRDILPREKNRLHTVWLSTRREEDERKHNTNVHSEGQGCLVSVQGMGGGEGKEWGGSWCVTP